MQNLTDWLQENQTAVLVGSPIGAALSGLGLRLAPDGPRIALFVALLCLFSVAPSLAARANKLQQARKTAEQCLRRLLEACGHSFGFPSQHMRVNVMKFTADRQRRKVEANTAFNMSADPDSDLEIDTAAGVSGQSALNRRPAFGDISLPLQPGGPDWGLRDGEKAKVRQTLKSILSVPVLNRLDPDGPLLGTLQIDSDLALADSRFDQEEMWRMAERFADVVSLLLEAGR